MQRKFTRRKTELEPPSAAKLIDERKDSMEDEIGDEPDQIENPEDAAIN